VGYDAWLAYVQLFTQQSQPPHAYVHTHTKTWTDSDPLNTRLAQPAE